MPVSYETYKRVVLEDTDERYELVCGHIRTKPLMTAEHGNAIRVAARLLIQQLDEDLFEVCAGHGRLRVSTGSFYVPDLFVLPRAMLRRLLQHPGTFEVYEDPVPLVVEAWSPSTGTYDLETKLLEYQIRGDAEIWRIHAYERTLTTWRRQPDGSYTETLYTGGVIQPVALPGVTIDIDRLWE
jgi:Uma2 family endonuclease